jgi:TDG/mug DNA glycosylase family protein
MMAQAAPSRADLLAARDKTVPDVIVPGLKVLFCGINPGLYSAAVRHHFARPGNRFWPTLHEAGFTPRLLLPSEERELLTLGLGITNLVARATAAADELTPSELVSGREVFLGKVKRYLPQAVAVVGIGAYRTAFGRARAVMGVQDERVADAVLWILPNPSGLNAHYQREQLVSLFQELRLQLKIGDQFQ